MRLLASLAATAALLVAVPATPASAVSTGRTVHVVSSGTESYTPSTITVVRGTDLEVVNWPTNPASYTYVVSNGVSSVSRGPIAPGNSALFTLAAGTYTLSRLGGSATATVDSR